MQQIFRLTFLLAGLSSILAVSSLPASSQVVPDNTFGDERSIITPSPTADIVSGGAARGSNLFHSFDEFNVLSGQVVYFTGTNSLDRIFARVTGSNSSNILGTLGVLNSDADLVLLNSNGITFGPNSNLSLTGSFLGTTADSVRFLDGNVLGSVAGTPPVLTNSIPVGLGFSSDANISVQSSGHTYVGNTFAPIQEVSPSPGLAVLPGQTLALLAGDISFDGGIVRAPDSRIELAAVREGFVTFELTADGGFGYEDATAFGNLRLSSLSLLETSGFSGGPIFLTGQQIDIDGGSVVFNRNILGPSSGRIQLVASDSINITGGVPAQVSGSALLSQNLGIGRGGDILIFAPELTLQEGGQITTDTFSSGPAGNINIDILDGVEVLGFQPSAEFLFSNISTATFSDGSAGNLQLSASSLRVADGAQVGSATFGPGSGGNAVVNASDIVLDGVIPTTLTPASINAAAFRTGDAGRLEISTDNLRVLNGARVGTSTVSLGDAGNTVIRAGQSVEVAGAFPGARNPSLIDSSANLLDPSLVGTLEVPFPTEGDAGSVEIYTPTLVVRDGGLITVQNEGPGDAGVLLISAEDIQLGSSSSISAATNGGSGGNINLMSDSLLVGIDSQITTSATGQGEGGNISIDSDAISLLQDSSISANAELGFGGQVIITTDALLQSPASSISATSEVARDGVVEVQAPDEAPRAESEIEPPTVEVPQVTAVCAQGGRQRGEFTVTGRGGLPTSPNDIQQTYRGWTSEPVPNDTATPARSAQIAEAQGWLSNGDGTIRFTDQSTNLVSSPSGRTACVNGTVSQNRNW
ncbi:MAG: filamentous hemagglutinin N-terminal domain-containing protein [Cyanobacteria bacterium J06649_5]